MERLEEMYEFISYLDISNVFKAEQVTILIPIRVTLPNDKQNILILLQKQISLAKREKWMDFVNKLEVFKYKKKEK